MKHYFRGWLFLPLVLGVIGLLLPGLPLGVTDFAAASLLVAGVPYAVFLVGALVWSGNREAGYLRAFLLSPLVFAACCFVYGLVLYPMSGLAVQSWSSQAWSAAGMALFCLAASALYCWPALIVWQVSVLLRGRRSRR